MKSVIEGMLLSLMGKGLSVSQDQSISGIAVYRGAEMWKAVYLENFSTYMTYMYDFHECLADNLQPVHTNNLSAHAERYMV
jgi:hypothetical protein